MSARVPRARAAGAAVALALALAALAAACDRGGERGDASGRTRADAPGADAPAAPAPRPALWMPPPGETRVERRAGRLDVAANEAPILAALEELSVRAGFRVERGAGALPEGERRTVRLLGVSAERAVAALLAGVEHHVHHEFADGDLDPARPFEGREVILARVTVGALPGGAVTPEAAVPFTGPRGRGAAKEGADADASRRARGPARGEAPERLDEDLERELGDPDPDVRVAALERMDPDGPEHGRLVRLLREDASPAVRAAAAEVLAEGDPFAATPPLLSALGDPDPVVVEAAVAALEEVYDAAPDPRIRQSVAVLREHRDPAVREAVEEFEAWIEE